MNEVNLNETNQSLSTKARIVWVFSFAAIVFVLDILTKVWAYYELRAHPPIDIIPEFFRLAYAENTGIAFSLFQDQSEILNILIPIAFVVLLILIVKMFMAGAVDRWYLTFFGLIIGGSLGNISNRMYNGFVVDFFDAYVGRYHWPTFIIADSTLTVGAFILAFKLRFGVDPASEKEPKENQATQNGASSTETQSNSETISS